MPSHTQKERAKKKVIKKSVADTTRIKKQIARDAREFSKTLKKKQAAGVSPVTILPGSRMEAVEKRLRANRAKLRAARAGTKAKPKKRR